VKLFLFIAAGGSLGAILRYAASKYVHANMGAMFPWGTVFVNLAGSFFIGFFYEIFEKQVISPEIRNFIAIGFLGAFTTFSTYSLETVNLLKNKEIKWALFNVLLQNITGIILVIFGFYFARVLLKLVKKVL